MPIDGYVQRSLAHAPADLLVLVARVTRTGGGRRGARFEALPPTREPLDEASAGQRRRRGSQEALAEAVRLYREALNPKSDVEHRAAPTQYVADHLHVSRGHASRLLSRARDEGLLGEARPGRAGEHRQPTAKTTTGKPPGRTADAATDRTHPPAHRLRLRLLAARAGTAVPDARPAGDRCPLGSQG